MVKATPIDGKLLHTSKVLNKEAHLFVKEEPGKAAEVMLRLVNEKIT